VNKCTLFSLHGRRIEQIEPNKPKLNSPQLGLSLLCWP